MPWKEDHKSLTRQRIPESVAVLFSRLGFDGISIDKVMEHAGLN
ncbi:hypothetical protein ACUNV4_12005 [Granulosicoccus sp. 3-233]